jgi:hypothetical protein
MGLAQSAGPRRPNRRSVLRQLTTDLDRAMDRATLKDKDRKKLDRARGTFQSIADLRSLGRADREDLRKALNDVHKRSGLFRPEDRRAVLEDLRQARDLRLDKGAPQTARPPRMPPPYRRRWPVY